MRRRLLHAAVAMALMATAASCATDPAIEVSGTLLSDGEWGFRLDESSTDRFDSGEADLDVGWRTSVRCTDGSRLRRSQIRAGWQIEVHASAFRGEHLPTLIADRVRVACTDTPQAVPPNPSVREAEQPEV